MSTGNTIGKVTGQPPGAAVPASAANQPVEKPSLLESAKTSTQQAIDNWVERNEYSTSAMVAGALSTAVVEVFMPTSVWELNPIGKAFKLVKKGAELAGLTKKGEKAVEAAKVEKKVEPAKGKDGGKIKPRGPCDHLRKGNGKGEYRGGSHNETSKPKNDGKDSHHMPADDASPLKKKDGPAIQMSPTDHGKTSSNGQMPGSIGYREMIAELIAAGKWREAMLIEIKDVQKIARKSGNPRKYNEAMLEMQKYFKCLEKHGLLK